MVDMNLNLKQLLSLYSNRELSDEQLRESVPKFDSKEKDELIIDNAIRERKEEDEYSNGDEDGIDEPRNEDEDLF